MGFPREDETVVPGESGAGMVPVPECDVRDPEDRAAEEIHEKREKGLDKTIADSFPTSDPPSSIPDPCLEDDGIAEEAA
jgi:hypothetical protein